MANADVVKEPKNNQQVQNVYIGKDGSESPRPQPDVVKVKKIFLESGTVLECDLTELSESLIFQAAAFGIIQAGSNAGGAAGSEEERIDKCDTRWDSFKAGTWSSERQSGPRDSDVIEAYCRVYTDSKGHRPSDAWIGDVRAKIADEANPMSLKTLQANPHVKAKLEAIRDERQSARRKKAEEALEGAALPDLDFE